MAIRVPPSASRKTPKAKGTLQKPTGALLSFRSGPSSTTPPRASRTAKRQPKTGPRLPVFRSPTPDEATAILLPTPAQAAKFVKLLNAGVPALDAIRYVLPHIADADCESRLALWSTSTALADANAGATGGAWEDLEPDVRIALALDKHHAELAYFLYTHRFDSQTDASTARKMEEARTALAAQQKGSAPVDDSPWSRFVNEQIDAERTGSDLGPPTLTELPSPESS